MAPLDERHPKKRDRTNENFAKAAKNLLSRCDQIRQRYGADVYIQVRRMHKYYEYTSSNEPSWPKTKAEMERTYPVPVMRTPPDFASRRNRVPTNRPSSTTRRLSGVAAEKDDAQHGPEDRMPKVDSRKVQVQTHYIEEDPCGDLMEVGARTHEDTTHSMKNGSS
ncbi:hypothetical protein BDP55DRAFT_682309 [Colletotrichum godetiae]|uniref:Uncharacterized protein n=1 Tax=Colletotrichum godetiae TaxID=1209918 RepID=A0AAJ0A8J5_9PEZI|nr:uncharacterized protein BDP55DRAFT_682309 [Colletotrichum godetiae]KAK1658509.1 hypothetical protein BDP55DRAFT_682309 [Colletotrichum godetiae]